MPRDGRNNDMEKETVEKNRDLEKEMKRFGNKSHGSTRGCRCTGKHDEKTR